MSEVKPEDYKGPSQFIHHHCHSVYSTLDGVSTPQQYADACLARGYTAMSITEHGHMGSVPDMHHEFKKRGLKFIAGCFLPSQPVLTEDGCQEIKSITPGRRVITDKNRPRAVKNVQVRDYSGDIVSVFASNGEVFQATPEHPFLVSNDRDDSTEMRKIGEITAGMSLCVPRLRTDESSPNNLFDFLPARVDVSSMSPDIARIPCTAELMWFIGFLLTRRRRDRHALAMTFQPGEAELVAKVVSILDRLGAKVETSFATQQVKYLYVPSPWQLGYVLSQLVLEGGPLPWEMISKLSTHQAESLMVGVCAASSDPKRIIVHRQTAWQLRLLLTKFGEYGAIADSALAHGITYLSKSTLTITKGHIYTFSHIKLKVLATSVTKYEGQVYNLEVEEDNTYNVGTAVHNCEIYFNDYEPERQKIESGYRELRTTNPDYYERLARNRHLTVLAKNQVGYTNLIKLTTQAYKTGFYYKPRIWFDKLCEYREGLIILSGCLNGPVSHELRRGGGEIGKPRFNSKDLRGAIDWAKRFKAVWGDDYYGELQMPGIENDDVVFRQIIAICDFLGIKVTLANDAHYLERRDHELQMVMMAIDQDLPVNSPDLFHVNSSEQYFKTRGELWARFKNNPYSKGIDDGKFEEMCDSTIEIADKCQHLKVDGSPKMPDLANADEKLIILVQKRLKETGLNKVTKRYLIDGREVTYVDQARIELERVIEKGYSSYFLITEDIIGYGMSKGWPFSPRGCSIPSSLVTMADGTQTPIVDIKVGDTVQDGFGAPQLVENKFIYDIDEDLIEIIYDGGQLDVTTDHKLYVVRQGLVELVYASEINADDEILAVE